MKYKLLKDLPFLKSDSVFGTGCWVGGGFGVDRGETHYDGGGSSHRGIMTFTEHENQLLQDVLDDNNWIEKVPTFESEAFQLYNKGQYSQKKLVGFIRGELIKGGK